MKFTKKEKNALRAIGRFYAIKYNESYFQHLIDLQIHNINYIGSLLIVSLGRPGLFIGEHGNDIKELGEYLKIELSDTMLHIKIEENDLIDYLMPRIYSSADCDYDYCTDNFKGERQYLEEYENGKD